MSQMGIVCQDKELKVSVRRRLQNERTTAGRSNEPAKQKVRYHAHLHRLVATVRKIYIAGIVAAPVSKAGIRLKENSPGADGCCFCVSLTTLVRW